MRHRSDSLPYVCCHANCVILIHQLISRRMTCFNHISYQPASNTALPDLRGSLQPYATTRRHSRTPTLDHRPTVIGHATIITDIRDMRNYLAIYVVRDWFLSDLVDTSALLTRRLDAVVLLIIINMLAMFSFTNNH